jgi:hypothetical protein
MNRVELAIALISVVYADLFPLGYSKEPAFLGVSTLFFFTGAAVYSKAKPPSAHDLWPDRVFCLDKTAFQFHFNGAARMSDLTLAGSVAFPFMVISRMPSSFRPAGKTGFGLEA